jgi:hypothetical protein
VRCMLQTGSCSSKVHCMLVISSHQKEYELDLLLAPAYHGIYLLLPGVRVCCAVLVLAAG